MHPKVEFAIQESLLCMQIKDTSIRHSFRMGFLLKVKISCICTWQHLTLLIAVMIMEPFISSHEN